MKLIDLVAATLLASVCAAQDGKSLVEGAKLAKITLVDAVQRASKALDGQIVGATLDVGTKEAPKASYAVLVLREGRLWTIDVDAQSGTVGKPRVAEDDDDDEKGEKERAHDSARKPRGPAAVKPEMARSVAFDLEDTKIGALPQGWRPAETAGNGKLANWRVEERDDAPSGKHVLSLTTENSGSTFNMLLSDAALPADVALSVRIHANTGSEDQGGGLVWRAKDADNYYLARWNPLEDNLRCYKVAGGHRSMFKSVELKADPKAWHRLQIAMQGKACTIAFDGAELLGFEDDTFTQAGRVGLWTKADAASSFDDFEAKAK